MQSYTHSDNKELRAQAKEIFLANKGKIIGLILGYALIALAVSFIIVLLTNALSRPVTKISPVNGMQFTTTSNSPWFLNLLPVFLIAPIQMGLMASLIDICRGNASSGLFCRMNLWLKSIGLYLWISIKTFLWALAGTSVMMLCVFLGSAIGEQSVMSIMAIIGMIAMMSMIIPASLRYSLAIYVMADVPSTGVFESVTISKDRIQNCKWQYFKLGIPYFLKFFCILLGGGLVLGFLAGLLGEAGALIAVIGMLALLLLALWLLLPCLPAYTLFYLMRSPVVPPDTQSNPL